MFEDYFFIIYKGIFYIGTTLTDRLWTCMTCRVGCLKVWVEGADPAPSAKLIILYRMWAQGIALNQMLRLHQLDC